MMKIMNRNPVSELSATIVSGVFWCLPGKAETVGTKEDCNKNGVEHKNKNGYALNGQNGETKKRSY